MIYDDFPGFVCEVCIVDAETRIKPIDFIGHELAWHKTLTARVN